MLHAAAHSLPPRHRHCCSHRFNGNNIRWRKRHVALICADQTTACLTRDDPIPMPQTVRRQSATCRPHAAAQARQTTQTAGGGSAVTRASVVMIGRPLHGRANDGDMAWNPLSVAPCGGHRCRRHGWHKGGSVDHNEATRTGGIVVV